MDELMKRYLASAQLTAEASADIAIMEAKLQAAKDRYEKHKSDRDILKREMARQESTPGRRA